MSKYRGGLLTLLFAAVISVPVAVQQKEAAKATVDTGPYAVVANWLKPLTPGTGVTGYGVAVDSPNRVFVSAGSEFKLPAPGAKPAAPAARGARGAAPATTTPPAAPPHHYVFVVDGNGKLIEEWVQWDSLFKEPHAIQISPYDREKHLWVIDNGVSQIFEFTNDGKKLLRTLGEKNVQKVDETHFGKQSDMAF